MIISENVNSESGPPCSSDRACSDKLRLHPALLKKALGLLHGKILFQRVYLQAHDRKGFSSSMKGRSMRLVPSSHSRSSR